MTPWGRSAASAKTKARKPHSAPAPPARSELRNDGERLGWTCDCGDASAETVCEYLVAAGMSPGGEVGTGRTVDQEVQVVVFAPRGQSGLAAALLGCRLGLAQKQVGWKMKIPGKRADLVSVERSLAG